MAHYPPPTIHPSRRSLPVLLSVPHSGRAYDESVLANAAKGRQALESLEDPLVDRLAWRAVAAGIGAVIQNPTHQGNARAVLTPQKPTASVASREQALIARRRERQVRKT